MEEETVKLHCPVCAHTFSRNFPVIDNEIILNDDRCPKCGAQAEIAD